MTIAIDFDGTIVEHRYPAIGKEIPFAIETLKRLQEERHRLILWTVREGKLLDEAVAFAASAGWSFMPSTVTTPKRRPPGTITSHANLKPTFLLTTAI